MTAFALPIAGAVIGGALRFLGVQEENEIIQQQTGVALERVNFFLAQGRENAAREVEALSRQGQKELGAVLNAAPVGNQAALEAISFDVAFGVADATDAVRSELRRRIQVAEFQRQDIVFAANQQLQNPLLAGLSGALEGAERGFGLQDAIGGALAAGRRLTGETTLAATGQQRRDVGLDVSQLELDFSRLQGANVGGAIKGSGAASLRQLF